MSSNEPGLVSSSPTTPTWVYLLGPCHRGPVESTREDGTVLTISKKTFALADPLSVFESMGNLGIGWLGQGAINRCGESLFIWLHEDGWYWALAMVRFERGMPNAFQWLSFYTDPSTPCLLARSDDLRADRVHPWPDCEQFGTLYDALQAVRAKHPLLPQQVQTIKQKVQELGV